MGPNSGPTDCHLAWMFTIFNFRILCCLKFNRLPLLCGCLGVDQLGVDAHNLELAAAHLRHHTLPQIVRADHRIGDDEGPYLYPHTEG